MKRSLVLSPVLAALWALAEALDLAALQEVNLEAASRPAFWARLPLWLAAATFGGALVGLALAWVFERVGSRSSAVGRELLHRWQVATFWPMGLAVGAGLGVLPHVGPLVQLTLGALSVLGLFLLAARRTRPLPPTAGTRGLAPLFFGSGAAALIYQVVWQRTLGAFYGTNIESATMVVSVFMLGLGVGSLVGAGLSLRFPKHAAELFLAIELGIGAFGVISLPLIRAVAAQTLGAPFLVISLSVLGLLVVPTILMGATLPILVAHVNRSLNHVGLSVAHLYALNALGSALACFLTADTLFVWLGQSGAVLVAAAANFIVGTLVFRFIRATREVAA